MAIHVVHGEQVSILRPVGPHAHTKTILETRCAADQDKMQFVPDLFIKAVHMRTVMKVDLIQSLQGMHIAASQKDDRLTVVDVCLFDHILRKEKQSLRERRQDLLERIVRFFLKFDP